MEMLFKKAGVGPDLSCVLLSPPRFIWKFSFVPKFLCLFELMLSVRFKSGRCLHFMGLIANIRTS